MSIDDKAIGHEGYTILSNTQTGKIAMMIESTKSKELEEALLVMILSARSLNLPVSDMVQMKVCVSSKQIIVLKIRLL